MNLPFHVENVDTICKTKTNHEAGSKKIILDSQSVHSNLTQIAVGSLNERQEIEFHKHPTMEEFFYFTKGSGFFYVEKDQYTVSEKSFIQIPPNTKHSIRATSDLEFLYWGVSL